MRAAMDVNSGGEGGIRTLEHREMLLRFQRSAFNRSATSPINDLGVCLPRGGAHDSRPSAFRLGGRSRCGGRLSRRALRHGSRRRERRRLVDARLLGTAGALGRGELRNTQRSARIRRFEAFWHFQRRDTVRAGVFARFRAPMARAPATGNHRQHAENGDDSHDAHDHLSEYRCRRNPWRAERRHGVRARAR